MGGWFRQGVTDGGSPISGVLLKQILQRFTPGVPEPSKQGLGLSRYMAHQMALAHGGARCGMSTTAGMRAPRSVRRWASDQSFVPAINFREALSW